MKNATLGLLIILGMTFYIFVAAAVGIFLYNFGVNDLSFGLSLWIAFRDWIIMELGLVVLAYFILT